MKGKKEVENQKRTIFEELKRKEDMCGCVSSDSLAFDLLNDVIFFKNKEPTFS